MSSRPDEVLAAIDAAVEDWELGPDAARWRPDAGMASQVADFARAMGMPVSPWQEHFLEFVYDMPGAGQMTAAYRRPPMHPPLRMSQQVPATGC